MLLLKPNCEYCNKDLPPNATDAMICSYECTFCSACVANILENVCPNCGGGFASRPIRPVTAHREGVSLKHQPASEDAVHTHYSEKEIKQFSVNLMHIPPAER